MKTIIYLVRHGESEANIQGVFAGSAEYLLTERGIKQAQITARVLSKAPIVAIYSSPLSRARKTAEPFSSLLHLPVAVIDGLREIYCGEWEGVSYDKIAENYPDLFPELWYHDFGEATAPGGESILDGGKRFYGAVEEIAKKHPGEAVLITAHAGVIRSFYGMVSGILPKDLGLALHFPTNASYSVVSYENGCFKPIIYSEDSELKKQDMVTSLEE